ncbi:alcohol dehydrogenase, partial [mine drainage metagenome]
MWFFRSPSIVYGEDSLSFLNDIPQRNILIITDKNIVNAGLLKKVEKELPEDSKMNVIDTVPVEPTISYIRSLKSEVESFTPNLIIGLGGGSCMDCAKVTFVSYERPDIDLYEITPL